MRSEQIAPFFEEYGYRKIPSNLPEYTFYYRRESQGTIVIHVIDHREGLVVSEEQYTHLKRKITEFLHARGEEEIHMLTLVLSSDTEKSRQLCAGDRFCWLIDLQQDRLIVYENQAEDFYGWRGILEEFLKKQKKEKKLPLAKKLPWVSIGLVAVNVIVFMICTFTGDLLYNKGALGVTLVMEDQSYYRMVTSMFLHADTGHLFSNMIILYYLGQIVERDLGHIPYAALYFLSGLAGGVLSMGYELLSGEYFSSVGASGAVFGVEGALLLLAILYRGRLKSMTLGRVVFAVAFSLYCGFTGTNVNNAAHVGGILMGFVLASVFCMLRSYIGAGKDGGLNED